MIDLQSMRGAINEQPAARARLLEVQQVLKNRDGILSGMAKLVEWMLANDFTATCWVAIANQIGAHLYVFADMHDADAVEKWSSETTTIKKDQIPSLMSVAALVDSYDKMLQHAHRHGFSPTIEDAAESTNLEDLL